MDGSQRELVVRFAEKKQQPEAKIYVGMLSRKTTEAEVRAMFEVYGLLKSVFLLRNRDGSSKGSALVTFANRNDALKAIRTLDTRVRDKDAPGPLQVRFAHSEQEKSQLQSMRAKHLGMGMGMTPIGMGGMGMMNPMMASPMGQMGMGGMAGGAQVSTPSPPLAHQQVVR